MEENFFTFEDPAFAVLAALETKKAIAEYNESCEDEKEKVVVTGYGIHTSDMLIIPGTDIHWGDAVNTASKLGICSCHLPPR